MVFPKTEKIWHNGRFINWDDANLHVMSHVISYGSAVFEGIRAYKTQSGGTAIFRENGGVDPRGVPIEVFIGCWEWGRYLGDEAVKSGVDVCVSSWNRPAPNTLPQMAKSAANYMNSQLIRMEATANGYIEGIALDTNGQVSEGSGENIFVVHDGKVITPPLSNSALPGITRNTVITICQDLDIPVSEQIIPREMLYIANEVFFSGTAAEVTPIRSIDRVKIGNGSRGPVTKLIQDEFFALVTGKKPDRHAWLSHVHSPASAAVIH